MLLSSHGEEKENTVALKLSYSLPQFSSKPPGPMATRHKETLREGQIKV